MEEKTSLKWGGARPQAAGGRAPVTVQLGASEASGQGSMMIRGVRLQEDGGGVSGGWTGWGGAGGLAPVFPQRTVNSRWNLPESLFISLSAPSMGLAAVSVQPRVTKLHRTQRNFIFLWLGLVGKGNILNHSSRNY